MNHGDHSSQKTLFNTWSQGRLALSQQSSRFELPMDMKVLETMKPTEYLSKYCVVTSKRQWLYEKIYLKHKEPKLGGLSLKGLDKALKEALVDTVTSDDVSEIIQLVGLTNSSKIDQKLFTGMAAMTERMLYPKFLTDDTQNIKDHKKEKIECADFCALDWKLHGVQVNPPMKKLLESL
ncbi:hypothetical protein LSH36_71g01027 [Paralvinella palmiformis]|uniref:Uncharacterized protein n=1 Tax=Paralvinella palmiformis TaxID=53620 RepID=A0AAD9K315_9ANNE|nr:hypothetical protein LSH36_71g01027 [Paralvinella palmiformis]